MDSVLKNIKFEDLIPDNIRVVDAQFVDETATSIRENGLLARLDVYEVPGQAGKYKIFDGHTRYQALAKIRESDKSFWTEVPCEVHKMPGDPLELRLKQLVVNLTRDSFCAADIADNVRRFRNLGLKEEQIALRLSKTLPWVKAHLKLADDGSTALKDANRKRLVTNTATQQLSAFDAKTQEKWVKKIIKAREKAKTKHESARAESAVVAKAFKTDKLADGSKKQSFPKPLRKKDLARTLADMHDMHVGYKERLKKAPTDFDSHEPRLEPIMRGVALVFGAEFDSVLSDDFDYAKWFADTFGADITDQRWIG